MFGRLAENGTWTQGVVCGFAEHVHYTDFELRGEVSNEQIPISGATGRVSDDGQPDLLC